MNQAADLPQFKQLGKLGTGGTAEVHKVLTKDNKTAALKIKLQTAELTDSEFTKLALREKHLLENINYPGIVQVYEIRESNPSYICLEYCEGKTLEKYGQIDSLPLALNILSSIAANLEFHNQKQIVHADLKPDNIFLPTDLTALENGMLSYTKLSDFSLGKIESEENSVRAGLGTIGFMAPETINDKTVSHQSDLFALGVIAYQLLSGKHPFITTDSDPVKINARILEESPVPLDDIRSDLPEALVELVNKLLEKNSLQRIKSAFEVCQTLESLGATFPYKKALSPKYFIHHNISFENNLSLCTNYQACLKKISNQKTEYLRCILTYNDIHNNICYSDKLFEFKSYPLIPKKLIEQEYSQFIQKNLSEKKKIVSNSLRYNKQKLIDYILPQFLSTAFVKRISPSLAKNAFLQEQYADASYLYMLSGNLQKAEDCAYQAAMKLKNENSYREAFQILNLIIKYGIDSNRRVEVKSLLMLKADLHKEIGETDAAEQVYKELVELYASHDEDELLAEAYKDLGDLCKMKKKSNEGIQYLEKALELFIKLDNELEISKTYNNLGNIYTISNEFKQALSYFNKALHIQKRLQAEVETASTLNNIGVIHAMTNRFKRALKIFNISLKIQKTIGNKGEIARTLNNIGYCLEILGNTSEAVETLQESLRYNKEINSKREILFNLENLTALMFTTGKLKESIGFLKEGIALASELKDKPHIGFFNLYMGSVLLRMGKLKDAQNSFSEVETILDSIDDDNLKALLYLEKSQLSLYINNKETSLENIQIVEQINEKLKDKTIAVKILLKRFTIENNLSLQDEIKQITEELDLQNEQAILNSYLLSYAMQSDNDYTVTDEATKLEAYLQRSDEHIEQCNLLNRLAAYKLEQNQLELAKQTIERSVASAKTRGLMFDLFHGLVTRGSILSRQNDIEKCYATYKQALEISKNIFMQLEDDADKQAFQNKKEFIFLVSEIKKLSQLISRKKEQV